MSLPHQTLQRLPIIKKDLLLGKNIDQIAEHCGVKNKTIDRDLAKFRNSGEFEEWLKEEWMRIHHIIIHEDPTEAYRNLTKLVSTMLTRRIEKRLEVTEQVDIRDITIIADYTAAVNSAVNRDLKALRAEQQVDTTESQATTTSQ